uniref:Ral transcription factor IIE subunit 2 n=2 Tax=Rhinopithecus TaxID=542827 RepID=A0A2K6MUL9_RHIBE
MDPSLLRERELFKKRALSTPVVEKRSASSESSSSKKKKTKVEHGGSSGSKQNSDHSNGSFNLKALSGSSGYKFGVLAKIVNYMKTRHQRGDTHPLTLDEILDETQHLDIGLKQKQWLMTEALVNNPKIEVIDGKYAFKPKYNVRDKKALLRLLDQHDQDSFRRHRRSTAQFPESCQGNLSLLFVGFPVTICGRLFITF